MKERNDTKYILNINIFPGKLNLLNIFTVRYEVHFVIFEAQWSRKIVIVDLIPLRENQWFHLTTFSVFFSFSSATQSTTYVLNLVRMRKTVSK